MTMVIMNNGAAMQALRENDSPLSPRIIKKLQNIKSMKISDAEGKLR